MTMSISNWSLAHISKVCNNVQYGAPYEFLLSLLLLFPNVTQCMEVLLHAEIFICSLSCQQSRKEYSLGYCMKLTALGFNFIIK